MAPPRPLIPRGEIKRMAHEIIAATPDQSEEAFARHQRAWFRSDVAEQIYWLRVRKTVRRRWEMNLENATIKDGVDPVVDLTR